MSYSICVRALPSLIQLRSRLAWLRLDGVTYRFTTPFEPPHFSIQQEECAQHCSCLSPMAALWVPYFNSLPECRSRYLKNVATICCLPLSWRLPDISTTTTTEKFFYFLRRGSSYSSHHHHFYDRYRKLPLLLLILCFLSGFLFLAKCKCKKKITTRKIMYTGGDVFSTTHKRRSEFGHGDTVDVRSVQNKIKRTMNL